MPPYIHMPSYAKSRDDEADRHKMSTTTILLNITPPPALGEAIMGTPSTQIPHSIYGSVWFWGWMKKGWPDSNRPLKADK